MFGKKPDLKKELNDLFVKNYSKMEDAILKPLQQKAYERLADNPNDIYLGKFNLVTFRPENVSYRSDMAVFNKKVPVIKLYINDKFEIDHDIVVQVITDYFGDGIDANGYSAENITVSLNGNDITLTANGVTFDNEGPTKDDFDKCEEVRCALDLDYRKYFSERLNNFDETIFSNYKQQILKAKEDGTLDKLLYSKQLHFYNVWMDSRYILLVPSKTDGTRPFENTQQLRCYQIGRGTVDGRSDYDAWAVSNIAYLRSKTAYLIENYNKELDARANELARLAGGRVDKNMSLKRYTITGDN